MNGCNFSKLVKLLDKKLNLDDRLEVLDHVQHCAICREAIYNISRDRDGEYFIYRPYKEGKTVAL